MQSVIYRGDNSRWLKLKIFHVYRHGGGTKGRESYFTLAAIRKRRYISPNKKRNQVARKAFNCIIIATTHAPWTDGQYARSSISRAAAFTRRIRRSRMKIKSVVYYTTRRRKYVQLARTLV